MTAIRALLTGLVDYAGLFPPQSLDMLRAVRKYRGYLSSVDRWALGRFVIPVSRLAEFSTAFNEVCCGEREPMWRLSVLSSGDAARDEEGIEGLARGAMLVDSLEMKAVTTAQAERLLADSGTGTARYVEFAPLAAASMLPVLARFGARAKIRMGGVTADAFPTVDTVAEFLAACARAKVAFKATAGLHHAVRGTYPLTYEPQSARSTMHGFVNVFLAAVLAYRGESQSSIAATLEETNTGAFIFGDESVRWLGFEAGVDEIEVTRRRFAISYGSCSFSEPIEEARHWEVKFREARSLEW
jgi:hypothetical protein